MCKSEHHVFDGRRPVEPGLVHVDGRQMVAARREAGRHRRQIGQRAYVEHQIHADQDVELEVTVEQPEACEWNGRRRELS